MRTVLIFAVMASITFGVCSKNETPLTVAIDSGSSSAPKSEIGCILRAESTCEQGESPMVTVELINRSTHDIYLVGSLDGSDYKWRYPHCYFEVIGPDGTSAVKTFPRCGNMNSLRKEDFFKVPARGTFDPYQKVDMQGFFSAHQLNSGNFSTPGEYRIRFFYSTNNPDIGKWGGDGGEQVGSDPEIMRMFRLVPRFEVRSEEIRVLVKG